MKMHIQIPMIAKTKGYFELEIYVKLWYLPAYLRIFSDRFKASGFIIKPLLKDHISEAVSS